MVIVTQKKEIIEEVAPDIFATIPKEETATIIVPLYGFFKEFGIPELTAEVLQISLFRLRSFFHKVYFVFVGERGRMDNRVMQVVTGKSMAANVKGVDVDQHSTYSAYLDEGFKCALEDLTSRYLICANPWIMLGKNSVDVLLERINRIDVAICSGFDLRKEGVKPAAFDDYQFIPSQEFRGFELNFFGLIRPIAEMFTIDTNYRTKTYLEKDILQFFHKKGSNIITSQSVPIYSFDINWSLLEGKDELEMDKTYFQKKWGFIPEVRQL